MNRVLFKILGAMAKEIISDFGIYPLEQFIALHGDTFLKNTVCRTTIYVG